MAMCNDNNKLNLYKGDYRPAGFYKGDKKMAGYSSKTFSGHNLTMSGTYNDSVEEIVINGGFVPSKNLLNKSVFLYSALSNEEPWSGYGTTVITNNDVLSMLKPNTTYTMSYDVECLFLPDGYENCTLKGNSYGLGLYSGVSVYPTLITYLQGYAAQSGTTINITKTFTTPSNFSDSTSNYRVLAYSNLYQDSDGNKYFPTVIFRNIQIEEGTTATIYEPYREPTYPVLNWNGDNISIPYILFKGDYIRNGGATEPYKVTLCTATAETDITESEIGSAILNFKTSPGVTTASISEGTLDVTVKISE